MEFNTLLSRQGQVVLALGRDLMSRDAGDRLPTVQAYAEKYDASVGTVQKALTYLQSEDIVKLRSRGHQGTFVVELNRRALWRLIHPGDLVGAMPLPYSRRYEGLATALSESLREAGLPLNLVFMRGAVTRLRALTDQRSDFAVLSAFAATEAQRENSALKIVFNLGPETYVSEHVLVFRSAQFAQIEDGMRVGIDPKSIDQEHMCRQSCAGKKVTFVEISYMQLPAALERGLIDGTVWNKDELRDRYPVLHETARSHDPAVTAANTEACIVAEATALISLLKEAIDPAHVCRIQGEVMKGQRLPSY